MPKRQERKNGEFTQRHQPGLANVVFLHTFYDFPCSYCKTTTERSWSLQTVKDMNSNESLHNYGLNGNRRLRLLTLACIVCAAKCVLATSRSSSSNWSAISQANTCRKRCRALIRTDTHGPGFFPLPPHRSLELGQPFRRFVVLHRFLAVEKRVQYLHYGLQRGLFHR